MIIDEHIKILLNKYDLNNIYNKYLILSILSILCNEIFYWLLLYFNKLILNNLNIINNCTNILFFVIFINIPIDYYFNKIKNELLKNIKIANYDYYINIISKLNKYEQLNFDLNKYYTVIDHLNDHIEEYINNNRIKYEIIFRFITLCINAFNKNYYLIIILFILYFLIINKLYKNKLNTDIELDNIVFKYDNIIRNYTINSKSLLINNNFNINYYKNNIIKLEDTNKNISYNNTIIEYKTDLIMFIYIFIIINNRISNINQNDFFIYFILIFDIQYVNNKLLQYYRGQVNFSKMKKRIDYLNNYIKLINNYKQNDNNNINNNIIIKKIYNKLPKIICNNELIININQHYLVDGISGSGKTSLLYLLKGILNPEKLEIEPDINTIINNSYLILPNHQDIYNGLLYDIITNYNSKPDIDIINIALNISNFIYKKNNNIIIEKLSSGEKIRLVIARTIYIIISNDFKILLFDEIDENLNDELAYEICKNLLELFKNKTILYITHNNKVKSLFNKKINVKDGIIN